MDFEDRVLNNDFVSKVYKGIEKRHDDEGEKPGDTIQLVHLHRRLAERELSIKLADVVLDKLADAGFDPVYGARPLKRAIQQELENPLAQEILAGRYVAGDLIEVDLQDGKLTFGVRKDQQAA